MLCLTSIVVYSYRMQHCLHFFMFYIKFILSIALLCLKLSVSDFNYIHFILSSKIQPQAKEKKKLSRNTFEMKNSEIFGI